MQSTVWFFLFVGAAAALAALALAFLLALLYYRRRMRAVDPDGRQMYISYETPDYTNSAGFRIERFPQTELLIPQAYWLINENIAEVAYNAVPAQRVFLRLTESGNALPCAEQFEHAAFDSVNEYEVDGVQVTQKQITGGFNCLTWSRNGFDFMLYAPDPQMNAMGGIVETFIRELEILRSEP